MAKRAREDRQGREPPSFNELQSSGREVDMSGLQSTYDGLNDT
jgi:hypothetical protein